MTGPVLVATDFSPLSVRAADAACELARALRLPLILAHVVEPVDGGDRDPESTEFEERLLELAREKLVQESARYPDLAVSTMVELGHRVSSLLALIARLDASMLVLGSSAPASPGGLESPPDSPRGATGVNFGVALRLVLKASLPILLVP
jgi:nucleotide-binding universal stress UspA family protein